MWAAISASSRPGISSTWTVKRRGMIDVARELAAEEEERHVGADDGHRLHEAVRGADAGAGEQVVGQRVAGEALERAEEQQQAADHPVELARLAVARR